MTTRGTVIARLPEKLSRFAIAGAAVVLLGACSAILGLTDPRQDDTIGAGGEGGSGGDGASSDGTFEASSCPGGGNTGDSKNCGTCGHDCLGGECNAGACQPVLVVDDETNFAPRFMVEDETTLYFTNARSDEPICNVAKVSKDSLDGSIPAERIARFDQDDGGNVPVIFPYQLAVTGSDIYVALTAEEYIGNTYLGGIAKCPGVNCDTNNLFLPMLDSAAVAANAQQVVYGYEDLLDGGLGSQQFEVHSYVIPAMTESTLASIGAHVNYLALGNANDVYIGADTGIFKTDTTGSTILQLTTFEADQLALFNGNVYVTSAPTWLPPTVQSVPIGGGPTTILAQGSFLHVPAGIAVDTNFIYVADSGDISQRGDGQVFKCPLSGCGDNGALAVVLSTGAAAAQNPRTIVAGDPKAIFWGNRYGQIWKLAK